MLLFTAIITSLIIVIAVFLLNGKGAFLIAGYNTLSKKEKEKYNEKALCKCVGFILIGVAVCIMLFPLGDYLKMAWITYSGMGIMFAGVLGGVIFANTSKRFRNTVSSGLDTSSTDNAAIDEDAAEGTSEDRRAAGATTAESTAAESPTVKTPAAEDKSDSRAGPSKKTMIFTLSVIALVFIAVSLTLAIGSRDPVVVVGEGSIQIKAMYGVTVCFSDISAVTSIPASMSEIGAGTRTNGYGGFGDALKGNFQTTKNGDALLFVRTYSEPTLRIDRVNAKPIFISFRNAADTTALYNELSIYSRNQR